MLKPIFEIFSGNKAIMKGLTDEQAQELNTLLELCKANLKSFDSNLIVKAFRWCIDAHKNKIRKSGKPYFTHPVAVSKIVVEEMPLDDISVASALLHDVLDYSDDITLKDIKSEFGTTIAEIVDGITKIRHIEGHGLGQFDKLKNYQKLLLSMFKDVRIILIKLADRLHNMRTIEHLPEQRQLKIAKETQEIYSRFANRFGLGNIKWELEDLAFKVLQRSKYYEITKSISQSREDREKYILDFKNPIVERLTKDGLLKRNNIKFKISGRPKHIYSTYNKLIDRNLPIEELNDLFAVRIIIEDPDPNLCFYFYGIVCELYKPVPGTFKNYVYIPKNNGYQSLHTAVVGPNGKHVEVQFRTRPMHEFAEKGVAAHFLYKKGLMSAESVLEDENLQKWMDSVREILESAGDETPQDLLDSVQRNLFQDEIYVFTPKEELILLPKDSTPLDFAFHIHTQIGFSCIGAKINGKIGPLNTKLQSGDLVEILTSNKVIPKREWLNYVITSKARNNIHKYLKDEKRDAEKRGRDLWNNKIEANELKLSDFAIEQLLKTLNFDTQGEFFTAIGKGIFDLEKSFDYILYKLREGFKTANGDKTWAGTFGRHELRGNNGNAGKVPAKFPVCCSPLMGDDVIGIISDTNELFVHRRTCEKIKDIINEPHPNIVDIDWDTLEGKHSNQLLKIIADNQPGILNDITSTIISMDNTNILGISQETEGDTFVAKISVHVADLDHLNRLFNNLYKFNSIKSIERISAE